MSHQTSRRESDSLFFEQTLNEFVRYYGRHIPKLSVSISSYIGHPPQEARAEVAELYRIMNAQGRL